MPMVRPLSLLFTLGVGFLLESCASIVADTNYKSLLPEGATVVDSVTLSNLAIGQTYQFRLSSDTVIQVKVTGRGYNYVTGKSTYKDTEVIRESSSINYSDSKSTTDVGSNTVSAFRDNQNQDYVTIQRGQIRDIQKDVQKKTFWNFFTNIFWGAVVLLLLAYSLGK